MENLALQVRKIYDVAVHKADGPDPRGSKVQRRRRAEPAGPDNEDFCTSQLFLAFAADLRQNNVPAVALDLAVSKIHLNL